MLTTAVLGCRPHEMRPARGNATFGWLPSSFYAGSPIRCTHWASPAAGEGMRCDESRKGENPMTRPLKSPAIRGRLRRLVDLHGTSSRMLLAVW